MRKFHNDGSPILELGTWRTEYEVEKIPGPWRIHYKTFLNDEVMSWGGILNRSWNGEGDPLLSGRNGELGAPGIHPSPHMGQPGRKEVV